MDERGGGGVVGGGPNNEDTTVSSLLRFSTSSTGGLLCGGGGIFLTKEGVTSCTTNRDVISVRTFKISSVVGIPDKV